MFKTKGVLLVTVLVLSLFQTAPVMGCEDKFQDVNSNYWAYQQINQMAEQGIISGYPDNSFRPEATVSRAEFAKMMVLSLNLPTPKRESSFHDIPDDNWACPYIEAARSYLTGFRSSGGDYFRPNDPAVREDMAVALVKALGLEGQSEESLPFDDRESISPQLRKYVAIAYKNNLMEGDQSGGGRRFRPQDSLNRAEAAVLLMKVKGGGWEKVTYPDETQPLPIKTTEETSGYVAPQLNGEVSGDKILLNWTRINHQEFQGYKVVISRFNPTPSYPDDGYLYYITDKNHNYATVDNSSAYNGGDFGGYLAPGERYYFSITALYSDRKIPGNVITMTYPGDAETVPESEYIAPQLDGEADGDSIRLNWTEIDDHRFQGYKVVISKHNSHPKYPDDGYLFYITDKNHNYAVVDNSTAYNGGDFGGYLVPGERYYFSITALYSDRKVPGNVITMTYPGDAETVPESDYIAPQIEGEVDGDSIHLNWTEIDDHRFQGYKVVISKNNSHPKYPDDGYLFYITDKNHNYAVVDNSTAYNGGDFGGHLVPGESYYFSITALYSDRKIPGNVITMTYPL